MDTCIVCGKKIANKKRSSKIYCSGACRTKAFKERRRQEKISKSLTMSMFESMDMIELKTHSVEAHNIINRMYATKGKEVAELALNAAMAILMDKELLSDEYWKRQDEIGKLVN